MVYNKLSRCVLLLVFVLLLISAGEYSYSQEGESDQQINDFSLAGFGDKGKKTWDLSAKSADIYEDIVKLNDIIGNLYGKKEDIRLTADKGDFDKRDGRVHLKQNVKIVTSSGAELKTDSLDWDRKNEIVATDDKVNIVRDNMVTTAQGARGEPTLNRVTLEKEVTVEIDTAKAEDKKGAEDSKVVIVCDGPLEVDYAKNVAIFKNNVVVTTQDIKIYSDTMEVYFNPGPSPKEAAPSDDNQIMGGSSIDKIVSKGNVKIVRGGNVSYSQEAIYNAIEKKIVLTGRPRLILQSTGGMDASSGN